MVGFSIVMLPSLKLTEQLAHEKSPSFLQDTIKNGGSSHGYIIRSSVVFGCQPSSSASSLLSPTLWFSISCRQLVAKQNTSTSSESILNRQPMPCFQGHAIVWVGQRWFIEFTFYFEGPVVSVELFWQKRCCLSFDFFGFGQNQGQHQVFIDRPPNQVVRLCN